MLSAYQRLIMTLCNLGLIAAVPLMCRMLAVNAGRAQPYLATISGHYLQAPERYVFAAGVVLFVVVHVTVTGFISTSIPQIKSGTRQYCQILEMILLGAFLCIACAPAHLILGLHATLGSLMVGISLLWMSSILKHISVEQATCYWVGHAVLIMAVVSAIGMITSFPFEVVSQLISARGNLEQTFFLLAWDKRWFVFACYEWTYYYSIIAFMLIMITCNQ